MRKPSSLQVVTVLFAVTLVVVTIAFVVLVVVLGGRAR